VKKFLSKHRFWLVIASVIGLLAIFSAVVPHYRIATGSMEPTLPVGTIVLTAPVDELKIGDVITFQQEGMADPVTHAFIGYEDDGSLMTMGDANPTPDFHEVPLTMADVKGKVYTQIQVFVPGFWLSTRGLGFILLIAIGITLYVTRDKKADQNKQESQSDTTREETREPTPV